MYCASLSEKHPVTRYRVPNILGILRDELPTFCHRRSPRVASLLAEVYAYHGRTEQRVAKVLRDRQVHPLTRELSEPYFRHWETMRDVLAAGWKVRGRRRELLLAAIGHALDFGTWRSLVRQQGLHDEQAIDLMVCAVRCASRGR